ncbi:hypothetical protein F5Y10DRAFT_7751 [Nemania abortiva]|nr:hypothetical protein F5Y10DRAFT_7751 [Nemania abortiva]
MSSELRRPPTRTASGSRPPTSRFQEGSMNDRISAAPPAQFLGPEQLKDYEDQFYPEPPTLPEARRPRPFSASAQLQATTVHRHIDSQEPQLQQQYQHQHESHQQQQQQQRTVAHKKSTGFFGRVRDALFHRGGGGGHHGPASKQQEVRRKHSSLQEPLRDAAHAMSPPRPDYLQHAGRTQSEINIAQMFPNPRGGADRPSREDVMASYNQLVSSGFFQSHAIQSTRHAAPGAATGGRQTPVLPAENQAAPPPPRPQMRLSSIRASPRAGSVSPMPPAATPSPKPKGQSYQEHAAATLAAPAGPRSSLSSLFRPSIPDLHTSDSRISLRGRKRARGDGDEASATSAEGQSSTGPTSYFSQPLRRVAKKLREMPSATFQSSNETDKKNAPSTAAQQQSSHQMAADGIVQLTPSVTSGGSLYPNERPVRFRSPSPAAPEVTATGHNEWKSEAPLHSERASSAMRARRPRRTFSYTLTESVRGRTRNIERECERERERDHGRGRGREQGTTNKLQRRGSSAGRSESKSRAAYNRRVQMQNPNPLGVWQRVSLEDTVIHRDSVDSTRSPPRGWDREDQERTAMSPTANGKTTRKPAQSPLRVIPDANRGAVPSMPKAPERWHGTGKAYHLKDRGSRPELTVRQSADNVNNSGKTNYGKENDWRHHQDVVDADGDIDLLGNYEARRQPREKHYLQQQQQQQQLPQHQWRIGNAL